MKEIVIVPAWRRPEMLYATLHRLALADDGAQQYRIVLDRGCSRPAVAVARDFAAGMPATVTLRPQHPYRGNSYNVLTAYAQALNEQPDLIYLVEEDVFVARDFFTASRAAHMLCPQALAVSAARNQALTVSEDPEQDPHAVWLHPSYQSLAVSWRPAQLQRLLPHAVPPYWGDPVGYCARTWPASTIPAGHAEQDGLINRVREHAGLCTAYLAMPRAYHAGFYGYNRAGRRLVGGIETVAHRLLTMTAQQLNAHARSYPDHTVVDLDAPRPTPCTLRPWPDRVPS